VDCISQAIGDSKKEANCEFIPSPSELGMISNIIKKAIMKGYTLIIFDSMSDLLIYGLMIPTGGNVEFIKSFLPELEKKKGDALFICKSKDRKKMLIQETLPIFKKIIGV
jgi:hypothetical protein